MNIIYTVGYSKVNRDDLLSVVEEKDLYLLDIRIRAGSRKADWNKGRLEKAFGERYHHIRELGNVNYRNQELGIQFKDEKEGLRKAAEFLKEKSVVLMCACSDVEQCHRKPASELLAEKTGADIVHWIQPNLID